MRQKNQPSSETVLDDMLDAMLPRGGFVSIQVQAYFDESGTHEGSHVLCVAGYIFEKRQARKLSRDWLSALEEKRLDHFHMVDCAHGAGPFANLTKNERSNLAKRMIEIIKARTILGIAVTINSKEFAEIIMPHRSVGSAYTFASHLALAGVFEWLERTDQQGKVGYFFESGHKSQNEANRIMNEIFEDEERKKSYRYGAHGFVEKKENPAVQAADLLAWQWYTDKRHILEGKPRRKDLENLLQHRHVPMHIGRSRLLQMASTWGLEPPERQTIDTLLNGSV